MFLDSAADRNNVISRARQLGYVPSSSRGAEVKVHVQIDQPDSQLTTQLDALTIIKGHSFLTSIEGAPYSFLAKSSVSMSLGPHPTNAGLKVFSADVDLIEGIEYNISFLMSSNPSQKYVIPNLGVDVNTLTILVRDAIVGTSFVKYNLAKNMAAISKKDEVYWLEEGPDGMYQVYFGDGTIGKLPTSGSVIQITYNICNGELGNGSSVFNVTPIPYFFGALSEPLTATQGAIVTTLSGPAAGGSSRESIDSIKYLAPLSYETQGRAVTAQDYKSKLLQEYTDIDSIRVWGGEEESPPDYGAVYIAIKPKSGLLLTDTQKNSIINDVLNKNSVVTVRKTIVDPEYIHLILSSIVKYDSQVTSITQATLGAMVLQTIMSFGQTQLDQFDSYFRHSNLLAEIDIADSAITNSLVNVKLKKIIKPTFVTKESYVVDFANPIINPHRGHQGAVSSSSFVYNDAQGSVVTIIDDGAKNLQLREVATNRLVNRQIGKINYDSGVLTINELNPKSASDNMIEITVIPKHNDIVTKTNQIISLAAADITIQMIDDSSQFSGTTRNPNYS
jgi:hypothetical protein